MTRQAMHLYVASIAAGLAAWAWLEWWRVLWG